MTTLAPPLLRPPPHLPPTTHNLHSSSKDTTLVPLSSCDEPHRLHLPSLIKSCARHRHVSLGRQLHALSVKLGCLVSDPFVQSSLISFYASCSLHALALQLFDELPEPNIVSYTSAIDACVNSEQPELAFSLFHQMLISGISSDSFSLVALLSACADNGALNLGCGAHALALKIGLELSPFLVTALISMYSKCSSLDSAMLLFQQTPEEIKSLQVWNAVINALALHGHGSDALKLFEDMISGGFHQPNSVTFLGLLSGCTQSGLVQEGKHYFNIMTTKFGIEPTIKHYGCMVDLLGMAGLLNEAFDLLTHMPIQPNYVVCMSLLRSCSAHGDVSMAERVMDRIMYGEIEYPMGEVGHFAIMSGMYRKAGVFDRFARTRYLVERKQKGKSQIEIGGNMHEFSVGFHGLHSSERNKIIEMLDVLDVKLGKQKEEANGEHHSEKVAVSFGLIKSNSGMPIRVFNYLRVCKDCHDWMKFVSKSYDREIILRDCNRIHRFVGGMCSCRDYW
ncbi:hypothetical protein LUZ63_013336 [Rhynchospora breviuscula]|uniref:DYW domain-containing protein n=1 Tax=Rhynchospora breviuscula TaxID=2022672 RepID=A0A9Q0C8C5_9POAL|nr:hypothetical protein LUZ63_013336 [Rhynchospora breviuscula]